MLEENQVSTLSNFCGKWISELEVPSATLKDGETKFTSTFLLPWLSSKVSELNKPGLYVRGDGGPSVRPLLWEKISFYPDLAIVEGAITYISFEVKILTNNDAGGALNKGIGQTAMYAKLGYRNSFGLVFEQRSDTRMLLKYTKEIISGTNFSVSYFS